MTEFKEAERLPLLKGESEYKLAATLNIMDNSSEVLTVQFSPDGAFIAAGCGDGSIRVFHAAHGELVHTYDTVCSSGLPITCIRFRPNTLTNHTFLSASAAGPVQHWHMSSGKSLHTFSDKHNQVNALDFSASGAEFATAGRDGKVRIYDESTKQIVTTLEGGIFGDYSSDIPGHSNRVFSVKFTHDENLLLSGGWDNTVHIWDVRTGGAVRCLYGPHICGDALDVKGNEIVTGSWRANEQLELWDFSTGKRIKEIPWGTGTSQFSSPESNLLYSAQFSKDYVGRFIAAGGSGANEAKIFDHAADDCLVGLVSGFSEGVYAVDFSPDCEKVAIAGGDRVIRILDIVKRSEDCI